MEKLESSIKEIYEMYQRGISSYKIAEIYHCSPTSVLNYIKKYCKELNLPLKPLPVGRKSLTLPIEVIYEMRQSGISIKEISDLYGCAKKTIYNHLYQYCKKNNLPFTPIKRRKTTLPVAQLYEQYQLGVSYTLLSERFGCHRETIRRAIKAYCEENHIPFYNKSPNQNIEMTIHQLYEMYQAGVPYRELGKKFHCSYRTVFRKLHQYSEEHKLPLRGYEDRFISRALKTSTDNSQNKQNIINENNYDLEWSERRKELLLQLKELLQTSRNMNLADNDTVKKLAKCKAIR